MVKVVLKYSDTVKVGNPIEVIMFFNSDKDFVPNKTSQVLEEINQSCLVFIGIDIKTRKPKSFVFYNEEGKRLYWEPEWKPLGN